MITFGLILILTLLNPALASGIDRQLKIFDQLNQPTISCQQTASDEGQWCQSLHEWSCAQEEIPDGTESPLAPVNLRIEKAQAELKNPFMTDVLKAQSQQGYL
ncbi:MAG: hypothetical protein H0V66_04825 [Bdellovibrionales bacterium]|nr:hypothetical protein [Bdellovibrionales bacterium]